MNATPEPMPNSIDSFLVGPIEGFEPSSDPEPAPSFGSDRPRWPGRKNRAAEIVLEPAPGSPLSVPDKLWTVLASELLGAGRSPRARLPHVALEYRWTGLHASTVLWVPPAMDAWQVADAIASNSPTLTPIVREATAPLRGPASRWQRSTNRSVPWGIERYRVCRDGSPLALDLGSIMSFSGLTMDLSTTPKTRLHQAGPAAWNWWTPLHQACIQIVARPLHPLMRCRMHTFGFDDAGHARAHERWGDLLWALDVRVGVAVPRYADRQQVKGTDLRLNATALERLRDELQSWSRKAKLRRMGQVPADGSLPTLAFAKDHLRSLEDMASHRIAAVGWQTKQALARPARALAGREASFTSGACSAQLSVTTVLPDVRELT